MRHNISVVAPFKWPFPPPPKSSPRRVSPPRAVAGGLTPKAMVVDVLLVLFWGASIPGLMWLGAAGGF